MISLGSSCPAGARAFIRRRLLVVTVLLMSLPLAEVSAEINAVDMPRRTGWYLKGSASVLHVRTTEMGDRGGRLDSALQDTANAGVDEFEFSFDDGYGFALGGGFRFPRAPAIAVEAEYLQQRADFDNLRGRSTRFSAEGTMQTHSAMANLVLNVPIGETPIAVYGGTGLGAAWTSVEISSIGGLNEPYSIHDTDFGFAYQVLGGMSADVGENATLFVGARYFDAGDVKFDDFRAKNRSIGAEIGLRLYLK